MKFDKWFSEKALDFWLQYYLRYKFAKHLLLPRTLNSQLGIDLSVSIFFDVLKEELSKVEGFYTQIVRLKKEKWATAIDRLQGGMKNNRQRRTIQEACEGMYMALTNLREFASVNYEGFSHLLNKQCERLAHYGLSYKEVDAFDTLLQSCEFVEKTNGNAYSNSCVRLINECEIDFSNYFFEGDIDGARKCLQNLSLNQQFTRTSIFMFGLFAGLCFTTATVLWIIGYEAGLDVDYNKQFVLVFPLFRGVVTFSLYNLFLGANIYTWNEYVIDFKHLIQYRSNIPPAIRFFSRGLALVAVLLICFGLYIIVQADLIHEFWFPDQYLPLVLWIYFIVWLVFPLKNWFQYSGRTFMSQVTLESLISPFSKVEFSHIFIIDQFVSLVIPLIDLEYTFCYYSHGILHSAECTNKFRFVPVFINILPYFIRTMQCLRMVWDSGTLHHLQLINAGKFVTSIMVILVSYCYNYFGGDWIFVWIIVAFFSTCYSFSWDLISDWGLMEPNAYYYGLRRKLIYKRAWVYYAVIGVNLLLRFTWTLTISPYIVFSMMRPELFTMFLGIGEAYRRIQWNFFRMEWEQLRMIKMEGRFNLLHNQHSYSKPLLSNMNISIREINMQDIDSSIAYHRKMLKSLEAQRPTLQCADSLHHLAKSYKGRPSLVEEK